MKKHATTVGLAVLLGGALLYTGCSSNMFAKGAGGAAAGAASAGLLGAVTDLIIDGSVNTSRLERNLVSGALAGGTAGAAVGYQQDQHKKAAQQTAPAPAREDRKKLAKEIGSDNVAALEDLIAYRHEDAYARTLKSTKSKKSKFQAAGFAIQALIDQDRGNKEGVEEALNDFIRVSDQVDTMDEARKGLKDLGSELKDERKIRGVRKP